MVYYGDHTIRHDIEIEATCTAAAPAKEPADVFAPVVPTTTLGQSTYVRSEPMSHHEQKLVLANGPPPPHTSMFFSIYFAMTGLHGLHVLMGIFVYIWLLIRATKGHFGPSYFGPVDYAALYWHLVDLIWIFLFPLLYLIH
jgi:heme/copper-type cytochrome/quinol oxidase subunit 3